MQKHITKLGERNMKMIVVRVYRYVILRVPKGTDESKIREQAIELFNKIPNEEAVLTYDYEVDI